MLAQWQHRGALPLHCPVLSSGSATRAASPHRTGFAALSLPFSRAVVPPCSAPCAAPPPRPPGCTKSFGGTMMQNECSRPCCVALPFRRHPFILYPYITNDGSQEAVWREKREIMTNRSLPPSIGAAVVRSTRNRKRPHMGAGSGSDVAAAAAAGAVGAAVAAVYAGTLPPGLPGGDAGNVPSTHRGAGTGAGGLRLGRTGGWLWGGGTGGRSELWGCCRDVCPIEAGASQASYRMLCWDCCIVAPQ